MPRGVHLSLQMKQKILEKLRKGEKQSKIAKDLHLNKSIISRTISNYNTRGTLEGTPKSGRRRKTDAVVDRNIKRMAVADPFVSASLIKQQLGEVSVSVSTIKRRLKEAGLYGRKSAKKPFISRKNREARLKFAREHVNWSYEKWKTVLFSDESRFKLFSSDGICWVRRPVNERFNPKYTRPTIKHGGGGIMVWGCFGGFGMGPLVKIDGIMDRFVYQNILENHMLPWAEDNMSLRWVFQHDNDPKHTSKVVKDWLIANKVNVMVWSAQSPDLNPIENLWDEIDRRLHEKKLSNVNEMFKEIQRVWNSISGDYIEKLIRSMKSRCQAVITSRGYATRY